MDLRKPAVYKMEIIWISSSFNEMTIAHFYQPCLKSMEKSFLYEFEYQYFKSTSQCLKLFMWKYQLIHVIKSADCHQEFDFCVSVLNELKKIIKISVTTGPYCLYLTLDLSRFSYLPPLVFLFIQLFWPLSQFWTCYSIMVSSVFFNIYINRPR